MKIVNERPLIYDEIIAHGMHPHEGVVYTYGDTIYNPSGVEIPDHLIEHEHTHMTQQGNDPIIWWERYLNDPYFRILQEAEAYGMQYKFLVRKVKDKNARYRILLDLGRILAGPIYGNIIGKNAAIEIIKNKAHI